MPVDAGFIGIKKSVKCQHVWIPYKASKKHPLTKVQKAINTLFAHVRVAVENAIAKAKSFFILRIENRMRRKAKLTDAMRLCTALANYKTIGFKLSY